MNLTISDSYCFLAQHSGKILDVKDANADDGACIQQWTLYGAANQQWWLMPVSGEFYEMIAVHSGKCLDDGDFSQKNGGRLHQWTRHGGENQKWRLIRHENESVEIASKLGDLRLDVAADSRDNGGAVQLWAATGGANQIWRMVKSNDIHTPEIFKGRLNSLIDMKFTEIMASKPHEARFLNYADAKALTAMVRAVFQRRLDHLVPKEVEVALTLSEAVLAPSVLEKMELLKKACGVAGGAAGIALIITGIGTALGWGAGVIAAIHAFLIGGPVLGPVFLITGGAVLAVVAGYFALTNDAATDTERFLMALKNGVGAAILPVWAGFGDRLWQKEKDK